MLGAAGLAVHVAACAWVAAAPPRIGGWAAGACTARDQLRTSGGERSAFLAATTNLMHAITLFCLELGSHHEVVNSDCKLAGGILAQT